MQAKRSIKVAYSLNPEPLSLPTFSSAGKSTVGPLLVHAEKPGFPISPAKNPIYAILLRFPTHHGFSSSPLMAWADLHIIESNNAFTVLAVAKTFHFYLKHPADLLLHHQVHKTRFNCPYFPAASSSALSDCPLLSINEIKYTYGVVGIYYHCETITRMDYSTPALVKGRVPDFIFSRKSRCRCCISTCQIEFMVWRS